MASSPPRARAALTAALLAGATLGLLGGCGDDAPPPRAAPGQAPEVARWELPPVAPAEQARYALDRLLLGVAPHEALPLPLSHHDHSLRMAKQDLAVLSHEAERLLADEALIASVTGDPGRVSAWHSVLDLLASFSAPSQELLLRWAAPAAKGVHPTLQSVAVGVLLRVERPEAAQVLFDLLVQGAADRHNGRLALGGLLRYGGDWVSRGMTVALRAGGPELWLGLSEVVGGTGALDAARLPGIDPTQRAADVAAWWALLAGASGPPPSLNKPRIKAAPFSELILAAHAGTPGRVPGAPSRRAAGPWPSRVALDRGWLPAGHERACVTSLYGLWLVGKEPAADTRCQLTLLKKAPYVAGVRAEREGPDPMLAERARHCMLEEDQPPPLPERAAKLAAWIDGLKGRPAPAIEELREIARALPEPGDDAAVAALRRVLTEVRPVASTLWLLEDAYRVLASAGQELEIAPLRALLASADLEDRGLGLHLAHMSRNADLLPDLERLHDAAPPEAQVAVRRTLIWIYSAGRADPGDLVRFVKRYARWVDEAPDAQAGTLATGLLEFGDEGAAALVERLAGPRQRLIVTVLKTWPTVLPTVVAEALADRLSSDLPPDLRHDILETLWRSAPSGAAGAIAASKRRLDPRDRPAIDVVLDVVRHRAAIP
jgi:hypothetical protein